MSRVLARCNGTDIVDRGDEVWIVVRDLPSPVWSMVAALLACVTFVNGSLQGIYAAVRGGNQHAIAAVVLAGLGVAFTKAGIGLSRAAAKAAAEPGKPFLIFADGWLLDADRRELAPLESVRFTRTFQLASSSRALNLTWSGGSRVIARGSPFSDSIADCAAALESLGLGEMARRAT